jgi:uncharacterized protein YeaO (DUF488 family)
VPKSEYAARDLYDVWLPELAPSEELLKRGLAVEDEKGWRTFVRAYRAEMKAPEKRHLLDLLAALSTTTSFAVGCYCVDATRCHRSVLEELLSEHGAEVAE